MISLSEPRTGRTQVRLGMTLHLINPYIAAVVAASTAATDAVYVMFTAAVNARRPVRAAHWSSLWYLLAAFAVINYTSNPIYALFAAGGSWVGAYTSVKWLSRGDQSDQSAPPVPRHAPSTSVG
jgi:hypothetical protein